MNNDESAVRIIEANGVSTVGGIFATTATAKYKRPCERKCPHKGDVEGCFDNFPMDNTNTRKS